MRSYLFKLVVVAAGVVGGWIKSLFHNWSNVIGVLYREAKEDNVSREVITWYTQMSPDAKVSCSAVAEPALTRTSTVVVVVSGRKW